MIATLRFLAALRRFRRLPPEARRIVFYSESGQDWHHFDPVIRELTDRIGTSLCYVTSDPQDPGLETANERVRSFCIGPGLPCILFFQFLKADVMVLTMVDLHNLHLKRSIHPVHYVFMFHSLISAHMADFEDSYDHYDTVLCAGPHHLKEIRRREEMKNLPPKNLVPHGYHRLEHLVHLNRQRPPRVVNDPPHVLVAPSWGEQTILNTCGEDLIAVLLEAGFKTTLRPHYQTGVVTPEVIEKIRNRFGGHAGFSFVDRMGEDESLFQSDVMITDWSGAGMDYGMGLEKPVLYVDLPPKSRNDVWRDLDIEPFESFVRTRIGTLLPPDRLEQAPSMIRELLQDPDAFRGHVESLREDWIFNFGNSAAAAAKAIADLATRTAPPGPDNGDR
jgi:YidC/Oxa1 family membrane protein insertase